MVPGILPIPVGLLPQCMPKGQHFSVLREYARRDVRGDCNGRQQQISSSHDGGEAPSARLFIISDLHTDYKENMTWVKSLSKVRFRQDALLVAGDVAESFKCFVSTMALLKDRFCSVFFVPGNHDLWCRREGENCFNSLEKLQALLDACKTLGVETGPRNVLGLGIIPLFSWYHKACKDYNACTWPQGLSNGDISLAQYFDSMNEKNRDLVEEIQRLCHTVVTFSHFVPRQELCPEKRMLFYPELPKIIGSDPLEARIRSIHGEGGNSSACHVFGHTHFCWDSTIAGIRYIQAPLAYPRERKRRMNGGEHWLPFCIYGEGEFSDRLSPCYWSDYYAQNRREPENTQLAPWVARRYYRKK